MLQNFSVYTNIMKPYNYEISKENQAKLTYFGREMYDIKNNDNVDVVYPYSNNEVFLNNFAEFHPYNWAFTIPEGNSVAAVYKDNKTMTAESYFSKLYAAYKPKWSTYLSKI